MDNFNKELTTGESTILAHNSESEVISVTESNGAILGQDGQVPYGEWDDISLNEPTVISGDKDVSLLRGTSDMQGTELYCWIDEDGYARVATIPNTTPLYNTETLYRFYWAIDTDILYLNMAERWQKIGTLDHNKMNNIGALSHEELEIKVNGNENEINLLKADYQETKTKVNDLKNQQDLLFQSVNNGKTLLEAAIIDKGGSVSKIGEIATFEELINGINSITTGNIL